MARLTLMCHRRRLRSGAAAHAATGRHARGWIDRPCCHSSIKRRTRRERQFPQVQSCGDGWGWCWAGLDMGQKETGRGRAQGRWQEMPSYLICIKMLHGQYAIMASNSLPIQWSASAPAPSCLALLCVTQQHGAWREFTFQADAWPVSFSAQRSRMASMAGNS